MSSTASSNNMGFILKLDTNGNFVWAKSFGAMLAPRDMTLDNLGNIYIAGTFYLSPSDFDPGAGTFYMQPIDTYDFFICKLDASGNFIWAKQLGGSGSVGGDYDVFSISDMIKVDALGNVYITGKFYGVQDFDPSPTSTFFLTGTDHNNYYPPRVAGWSIFIWKLDASGNFAWAKVVDGVNDGGESNSIALDNLGNVYTGGAFYGTVDFDPSINTYNLSTIGASKQAFLSKLDNSGNFVWAKKIIAVGYGGSVVSNIVVDNVNCVYVAGKGNCDYGSVGIDFGNGPAIINGTSFCGGFVAKYSQCPFTINNNLLPNGVVGSVYSQTMTQTSLIGTPVWSVVSGILPAGVSLSPITGLISGTTTVAGMSNFIIGVTNGICSVTKSLSINIVCPITINTNFISDAAVGVPYSQTIDQTSMTGTLIWSIASGSLPAGLFLSPTTGVLSGTPTLPVNGLQFTIRITNGSCSVEKPFYITVYCIPITFNAVSVTNAVLGVAYNLNVSATTSSTAGSLVYSITPSLPAGLSLNATTGVISGIPTTSTAPITYNVIVTQGNCAAGNTYGFAVTCSTVINFNNTIATNTTVGVAYNLNASATVATGTLTYSVSPALPAGLSLNVLTGFITGIPTTVTSATAYTVTATQNGCSRIQTYTFTVNIAPPTNDNCINSISLICGQTVTGSTTNATNDGYGGSRDVWYSFVGTGSPVTISMCNGTNYNSYLSLYSGSCGSLTMLESDDNGCSPASRISNFCSTLGTTYIIQVRGYNYNTDNYGNFGLTLICGSISPNTISSGTIGVVYNQAITQTGLSGTPTWSISAGSLPNGLSIASNTGIINGTPITAGTFNFTVSVTTGSCPQTRAYSIVVVCPTIAFINTIATTAAVGTSYNLNAGATVASGALVYSVLPALPAGLNLNTSTGVISGTPTTAALSATYVVTATRGTCSVTQGYTFAVVCPSIIFSNTIATTATVGTSYNLNAGATTASGALVYSVLPALPAGLSLNTSTGAISGTPTTATLSATYTVRATQGTCSVTQGYTFAVVCPAITFANTIATTAIVGTSYNLNAGATVASGTLVYSVLPALPAGLSLNTSTGVISGTPTTATLSATYVVTATQGTCSVTQGYTFAVVCPSVVISPTNLGDGIVGTSYNEALSQTGFTGAVTWSVSVGTLPAGLSLASTTGIISGTPTAVVTASFTVQVTQGTCSQTSVLSILIAAPIIVISNPGSVSPNGMVGINYNQTFTQTGLTGLTGTITWSVSSGALPPGLTLNPATGVISGVTTTAGTYTFRLRVDNGTFSGERLYTIVIEENPTTATDNTLSNQIKVYPNPSIADFNVDFSTLNLGKSLVRVYDGQGKTVFTSDTEINNNTMKIALGNVASGIYLLEVNSKKGRVVKRLIKMD